MTFTYKCTRKSGQSFGPTDHRWEVYLVLVPPDGSMESGSFVLNNLDSTQAAMFSLDGLVEITVTEPVV